MRKPPNPALNALPPMQNRRLDQIKLVDQNFSSDLLAEHQPPRRQQQAAGSGASFHSQSLTYNTVQGGRTAFSKIKAFLWRAQQYMKYSKPTMTSSADPDKIKTRARKLVFPSHALLNCIKHTRRLNHWHRQLQQEEKPAMTLDR